MTFFSKIAAFGIGALLLVASATVSATLVTEIAGLNINGTEYDVTFHPFFSFNSLWDNDGNLTFDDSDGSVFNSAPTFWGDQSGANAARDAIINYFGTTGAMGTRQDTICGNPPNDFCDGFLIPVGIIPIFGGLIGTATDGSFLPQFDVPAQLSVLPTLVSLNNPYASFELATRIPEPATIALMGLGLAGLGYSRRRTQ